MNQARATHRPAALDALLAAAFFALLWLPALDRWFGLDPSPPLAENRVLTPPPRLPRSPAELRVYPRRWEAWHADTFGFRAWLIRRYNEAMVLGLRTSPTGSLGAMAMRSRSARGDDPDATEKRVVLGREGWLYYDGMGIVTSDWRGRLPFSPRAIEAWRTALDERRRWLAARGIAYLFVIAPDKQSIHPEYLPRKLTRVTPTTRFDRLSEALAGVEPAFLDLRPALREAKREGTVYRRTDTHWNDRGAYIAYREIVARAAESLNGLQPLGPEAFEKIEAERPGGDLARMLTLERRLTERETRWRPLAPPRARRTEASLSPVKKKPGPGREPFALETGDATLPRAVIFRDSFAVALAPLLAEHFERTAFYWQREFDPAVIERERPDIVIEIHAERTLMMETPLNEETVRNPPPMNADGRR